MSDARYAVRPVSAGAYKEHNPKSFLTHICEMGEDGFATRVLCSRVKFESICDDRYATPQASDDISTATCPVCAKKHAKETK